MFKTRENIVKALMALKVEANEWDLEYEPERTGIMAKIFGSGAKSVNVPPPKAFPKAAADAYAALARPTIYFSSGPSDKLPVGASKIGGAPDLPPGAEWPYRPAMPDVANGHSTPSGHDAHDVDLSFLNDIKDADGKSIQDYFTDEMKDALTAQWNATDQDLAAYYALPGPLPFLAQINFADLAKTGALDEQPDMPRQGMLYLFYDIIEQPWGFDPKDAPLFKLVWFEGDSGEVTQREIPASLAALAKKEYTPTIVKPRALSPTTGFAFPDQVDDEFFTVPELEDDLQDALDEWTCDLEIHPDGSPDHRLGGWPNVVQNPMETQCALVTAGKYCGDGDAYSDTANADIIATSSEWRLLLQIDTDEDAGYMFGDCGRLYVWIKEADLQARAFDKAWVIVQCY